MATGWQIGCQPFPSWFSLSHSWSPRRSSFVIRSVYGPDGWTLDFWRDTFDSNAGRVAILTSVQLALICATLSLLVGAPLAWLVSRMVTARRSAWLALLNVAANFGGVGLAFAYVAALGTYGMMTLAVQTVGLPFNPPEIGSLTSLVLAYEYTNVPLFVLLIAAGDGRSCARSGWRPPRPSGRHPWAVLALRRAAGPDALPGRRLGAHLHLVGRHLRSRLRDGRHRHPDRQAPLDHNPDRR